MENISLSYYFEESLHGMNVVSIIDISVLYAVSCRLLFVSLFFFFSSFHWLVFFPITASNYPFDIFNLLFNICGM
jgi:hypothetical protein